MAFLEHRKERSGDFARIVQQFCASRTLSKTTCFFNALHDFANSAYSAQEKLEFQAGEIDDSTECHTRFVWMKQL